MYNKDKGITLIALAITVLLILILSGITVTSGINIVKFSKLNGFTTEMKMMQSTVNDLYERNKKGEKIDGKAITQLGEDITNSEQSNKVFTQDASGITDKTGYRYYNLELIKTTLGVEGITKEFFVNIQKRSIVSYYGLEYEGKLYYTIDQLPKSLYNVDFEENTGEVKFDVSYRKIEDNKFEISISNIKNNGGYINKWEVHYKLKEKSVWNKTQDYNFIVNSNGIYEIKLVNDKLESTILEKTVVGKYITDGLITHYDAINNTGEGDDKHNQAATVWKDLSGKGSDATLNGFNETEVSGWQANRLTFDGVDDWVVTNNILKDKKEMTIEYICTQKRDISWEYLWGIRANQFGIESGLGMRRMMLVTSNSSDWKLLNQMRGNANAIVSNSIILNKTILNGYKDGILQTNNIAISDIDTTGEKIGIGADGNGGWKTQMDCYSFRIYDRVLTDTEIKLNYEMDKKRFGI